MLFVKSFVCSPLQENTYLIYDEAGHCAIVDPGCYDTLEQEEVAAFIRSNQLVPNILLNTHCHIDHVFGNAFIHRTYGLTLHMHPMEAQVLAYAPVFAAQWGLSFEPYAGTYQFLVPGTALHIGDHQLEVLYTPGHSPGSVSFYDAKGKWVLSGDVLFRGSIGRTDLPGGDHNILLESVREQLFTLPEDVIVYSGHGPQTTIGYEKQTNPFFQD
jgi:glyoxylase-like metal-dependent hydrolase (beta-lactamase superfamily II)